MGVSGEMDGAGHAARTMEAVRMCGGGGVGGDVVGGGCAIAMLGCYFSVSEV